MGRVAILLTFLSCVLVVSATTAAGLDGTVSATNQFEYSFSSETEYNL